MQNEREKIIRLYQKSTKVVLTMICICGFINDLRRQVIVVFMDQPGICRKFVLYSSFSRAYFWHDLPFYTISWQLTEGFGYRK